MSDENNQQTEPQPAQPESQPEPQPANPYESIIEQQQQQIAALMEQTKTLNEQIVNMVQGGAQFTQQAQQQQPTQPTQPINTPSLSDDTDWTLEGLASEIGKKNV